jgi:hypothetical protein
MMSHDRIGGTTLPLTDFIPHPLRIKKPQPFRPTENQTHRGQETPPQ